MPLAGCRSHKRQAEAAAIAQEEAAWSNVQLPVTVAVTKPADISLSGTATMVRGEYIYLSLRFWGFEVGQVNITPEEADVVLKQPQKLWMHTPVAERIARYGVSFASLQEAVLGNRDLIAKVPRGVNVEFGGSDTKPEVTVSGKVNGKDIEVMLTLNLGAAKWDQPAPKGFTAPGSGYRQVSLEEALKKFAVK